MIFVLKATSMASYGIHHGENDGNHYEAIAFDWWHCAGGRWYRCL